MDFVNEKLEEFNKFLDGKKVAIIGMGVSNVPLLDYFYDKNAKVTVFDKRNLSDEIMEKIKKTRKEGQLQWNKDETKTTLECGVSYF